jgi:hypothetical protein
MNIIDIQDQLKNFSEQQLISEMQMPTGSAPQFLVLSEIKRRKRVRDDFMKREAANQPTVAEEAIAAAGVPQSGIMGMSEAMAPQAAVAEGGIGSIMPQSMRSQTMPAPTDDAIPMSEGGVIRANIGAFFNPDGTPTVAGLKALIAQESGGDPMARGSLDEVGIAQIRPSTAIMPGYGVQSMFPEISALIGPGKKYDTNKMEMAEAVQKAYEDNRELVDAGLIDVDKSMPFSQDYLTAMSKEFPDDPSRALAAYNVGPGAAAKLENPADFDYVTSVLSRMGDDNDPDREVIPGVTVADLAQQDQEPGLFSASASTVNQSEDQVDNSPYAGDVDRSGDGYNLMRERGYSEAEIQAAKEKGIPPEFFEARDAMGEEGGVLSQEGSIDSSSFDPSDMRLRDKSGLGSVYPEDDRIIGNEELNLGINPIPENLAVGNRSAEGSGDRADYEAGLKKDEGQDSSDSAEEKETSTQSPIISIGGDASTYRAGSLASEIKALQDKLDKDKETDKYLALAQAGLALMSSKEPTLLGAIGEAGVSGLTAFREAQDRYQEGVIDLINARAKLTSKTSSFTANQMIQRAGDLQTMAKNLRENVGTEEALQQARELEIAARGLLSDAGVIEGESSAMAGFEDK